MSDDEFEFEIPVLISRNKTLKSATFANRQALLLNKFKDLTDKVESPIPTDEPTEAFETVTTLPPTEKEEKKEGSGEDQEDSKENDGSVLTPSRPPLSKKARKFDDEKDKKNDKINEATTKKPPTKGAIDKQNRLNQNFRSLNMKGLKFKGGKLSGSKFKKKTWIKNKQNIEANARYGWKDNEDTLENELNTDHNAIATVKVRESINLDDISSDEGETEEEEVKDGYQEMMMSNDAVFNNLRKENK
jgi:hypothetical protein